MVVRALILCLLVFGTAFADKESVFDDESFNQLTEDLIKEIRKRISDDAVPGGGSLDECHEDFGLTKQRNTIIMTHDSLENGAEFVLAPTVNSGPECQAKCCDQENCNVAVFKFKEDEKSCYLFDCGNPGTCLFANHTGFTVTSLPKKKTAKVLGKNHEEDLVNLATSTTTTQQPTTTTTEKEEEKEDDKKKKPPVSLFGECEKDKDCAGSRTVCQVNYCVCQDGYHAQDGECREDCSRFEFECANVGQPLTFPRCIALYDTCDDVAHCSDGSDERQCPDRDQSPDLAMVPNPMAQAYIPPEQQQAYMDLQQQQLQQLQQQKLLASGYLPPPVQTQQQPPPSSLQQQIETLPPKQTVQQLQPQPGYGNVNPALQQQQQQQQQQQSQQQLQQPTYVSNQQLPVQPQQVYQPVQQIQPQQQQQQPQQPLPVQQQPQQVYSGQAAPFQQSQQQPPQPVPASSSIQGQQAQQPLPQAVQPQPQAQAPPQVQQPQSRPQPQPQGTQPAQSEKPYVPNYGEQYAPIKHLEDRPHQVGRKPGPAYEAKRPSRPGSEQATGLRDGGPARPVLRLDADSSKMNKPPQSEDAGAMTHSKPQENPHHKQPSDDGQGMQAEVKPIPQPGDTDRSETQDTGSKTTINNHNSAQQPHSETGDDDRLQNPPDIQYGNGNANYRKGANAGYPSRGGFTDGGHVSNNYNSPTNQFPRVNQGWDGSRPAPSYGGRNFMKPSGYRNPVYNSDYDAYDYGGGVYGGGYAPDFNYYYHDSEAPNSGETQNVAPPHSDETPNAGGRSGWDNNPEEKHKNDGKDSSPQKTEDDSDDDNDSDEKHKAGFGGDDNDSAEKHKDDDSSSSDGHKNDDKDSEEKHGNDHDKNDSDPKHHAGYNWDDNDSDEKHGNEYDKNEPDPKHHAGYDGDDNDSDEKHRKGDDNDSAEKHKNKSDDNDSDEKHKKGDDDDSEEKHRTGVRVETPQGDLQVNKEEMGSAKETEADQSNQGAVIALALGLSITALLLVFVGCRLRNVKRRLRRGRPLNSNEADYLVNGMYL